MLTNLKPYVPFSDLVRFDPFWDMNDLFTFPRPRSTLSVPAMEADIPIEVKEKDDAYVVKAGMPGLTRDDIHVAVDGNTVS
ncbi:MAG TPA: Hsp20 family protein, partial [Casimicrobiaceae bacterium]|nr:Hsp20 family protein [Casimicrobiaceae bacterium]